MLVSKGLRGVFLLVGADKSFGFSLPIPEIAQILQSIGFVLRSWIPSIIRPLISCQRASCFVPSLRNCSILSGVVVGDKVGYHRRVVDICPTRAGKPPWPDYSLDLRAPRWQDT